MNTLDTSAVSNSDIADFGILFLLTILSVLLYCIVRYIIISTQLGKVAAYGGSPGMSWMACLPGFRQFLIFYVSGRAWWFLVWLFVFLPAQIGIYYLFLDNLIDFLQSSHDIAQFDLVDFLVEMTIEDYWEAMLLSTLVALKTTVLVLMYFALSLACNRSPLWLLLILFVPVLELLPFILFSWGMKGKMVEAQPKHNESFVVN